MADDAHCQRCKESIDEANVEAFELTGELLCDECAEIAFEDYAQREYQRGTPEWTDHWLEQERDR